MGSASALCRRMVLRRKMKLPLPALHQRFRNPMTYEDVETLAEAYTRGRDVPPSFDDCGSTILPLALYLCDHNTFVECSSFFLPSDTERAPGAAAEERPETADPPVFLQSWCPPEDAANEWYVRAISQRGYAAIFSPQECSPSTFVDAFERVNTGVQPSAAEKIGLASIDRMAWKTWRTLPPMRPMIELANAGTMARTNGRDQAMTGKTMGAAINTARENGSPPSPSDSGAKRKRESRSVPKGS